MNLWSFPSNILPLEYGAFPPTFKKSDNVDSNLELSLQHMTNRELSQHFFHHERKSSRNAPKRFDGWRTENTENTQYEIKHEEERKGKLTEHTIEMK